VTGVVEFVQNDVWQIPRPHVINNNVIAILQVFIDHLLLMVLFIGDHHEDTSTLSSVCPAVINHLGVATLERRANRPGEWNKAPIRFPHSAPMEKITSRQNV
jgi:hypothetical protein